MPKFKLKNYTTEISAERTIMEIEKLLVDFGASHIMKEYLTDGKIICLTFKHEDRGYKLPSNSEGVYKTLYEGKELTSTKINAELNRQNHAHNVAWRIIKDWLYSQMSLIASGQAQPDQILLPYMFDGKRTLYEKYKDGTLQIEESKDRINSKDHINSYQKNKGD